MAPSNSGPRPVLTVLGEKAFQMMFSQMLVAINREIPDPRPYPLDRSSSRSMTINEAETSCRMSNKQTPAPRDEGEPYMPVRT